MDVNINQLNAVDICSRLRSWTAETACSALKSLVLSEKDYCQAVQKELARNTAVYPQGWYLPPPSGIAALFGTADNNYARLRFDTLRTEEFWPKSDIVLSDKNDTGIIYVSPIDIESGVIGDFGITIYRGNDERILNHLANSLRVLEVAAQQAQIGMQFCELHDLAQKLFDENGLTNSRTVTWTDKVGTNLGHTIPWSYEQPTKEEKVIIENRNFQKLSQLISEKRVNVNRFERFKIPDNIAFTLEARLESIVDPALPNVFFHLIITFKNGKKTVLANFNKIFQSVGIVDIQSKFD